jgi:hypothetical protein
MTTPGANIILDPDDQISSGAYADIFRASGGPLVYKLFIGFRHHTTVSQGLTDLAVDHRGSHPWNILERVPHPRSD